MSKLIKNNFMNLKKQLIQIQQILTKQLVSDKFRHNEESFKYFIGYQEDEIVKPFCIILPQMNGYIRYFENGGKNMSLSIKYNEVWDKYGRNVIKNKLNINFIVNLFMKINI